MTSTAVAPAGAGPIAVVEAPEGMRDVARPSALEFDFDRVFTLCERLVRSNLLPKHIRTPEAAFAIVLAGREMGIGPMLALRSLNLVEGKVTCAADLLLARFKADGGRTVFKQLDENGAVLWLRHPNGDEHNESFTMEDAKKAELLRKDNWKHYPKAMLRSRVITAGLKSVGYEPTAGVYDPDELPAPSETSVPAPGEAASSTNAPSAPMQPAAPSAPAVPTFPYGQHRDVPLNARHPGGATRVKKGKRGEPDQILDCGGEYIVRDSELQGAIDWAHSKLHKHARGEIELKDPARFSQMADELEAEQRRRDRDADLAADGELGDEDDDEGSFADDFDGEDEERYGEELTPAPREEPQPPPAKGAPDSVYALQQRFNQLIEHPELAQFKEKSLAEMREARKATATYPKWLREHISAMEQVLAGALEPAELKALGISPAASAKRRGTTTDPRR